MNYLYHLVPKDLEGSILYPLNTLKENFPTLYAQHSRKYQGREEVMQQKIPTLDCLWNDVLHFTAVHPAETKKALVQAGMPEKPFYYYEIDPAQLKPENTIVYLYTQTKKEDNMNAENFTTFDPGAIAAFSVLPEATKEYYKEMYTQGRMPLMYHRVPHILYKGSVDISKAKIITV